MDETTRPLLHVSSFPEQVESRLSTVRAYTRRYLNSKFGHYAILILVSLDCSCIFAEFIVQVLRCERRIPAFGGGAAQEALGVVGLVFSCLFMFELLASIWAFGFR